MKTIANKRSFTLLLGIVAVAICLFGLSGCGLFHVRYTYYDDTGYSVGGATLTEEITSVSVDWVSGSIQVVASDTAEGVSFAETLKVKDENARLRYCVEGGVLDIRFAAPQAQLSNKHKKQLTLTLPKDMVKSVEIASVSADISYEGVAADTLSAVSVSGGITFASVQANEVNAAGVSGGISVKNVTAASIFAANVSGSVLIEGGSYERAQISTASGHATLRFGDSPDFICTFSSVSGKVKNNVGATKSDDVYQCGAGTAVITVNTVSGGLTLASAA